MDYLIGIDIGTSSVKGVLMTTKGQVVQSARVAFDYIHLDNGGVELGAKEYLSSCYSALQKLASRATNGRIKGVCASSASGNLLLLDKENQPITNIISWQDIRVTEEAREVLAELDADTFYHQIGWPFGYTSFPLAQLCYIKKHQPNLLDSCGMVAMSTEYLYYALTGKWGISTSAGTTYYLIDQNKGTYMDWLLEKIGIREDMLPPILPCGTIVGEVQQEVENLCGISAGTPVILGSFDHPSAARGVGVLEEGEVLLSCGTSWVVFFPISSREKGIDAHALIDPFLSQKGGCWGAMLSVSSLSGRIQQYVHRYIDTSKDAFLKLSELCACSKPGANGLCINPNEDPNDDRILQYKKEDIARAIMEGTVYLLKEKLDILVEQGIIPQSAVMVGGPSEDPMWRTLIEEICGISVRVVYASFAGAVGAAVLAGIGVGEYENEKAAHASFENNII